jgi:hypothetical protein
MHEPVGESGPPVDIAQNLGNPRPRQHSVQPEGQIARSIRDGGRGASDVEFAVLDLDPVEFSASGALGHEGQSLVQRRCAAGDVTTGIGLAVDAGVPPGFGGQQVVLERPIVAAASDPDVAASQTLPQRGQHRRFVKTSVRRAVRKDQLAPLRRQERRRRTLGQHAGAVAIHRSEELDGGEHRIVGCVGPEDERSEEARAEPAQHRVSLGRRDEDVLIRHVGHGPDDGKHAIELLHADLAFDHGDAVLSGFLRMAERGDGAAEQDQRPGNITPRRLEALLVPIPRPAEQGAHVFLEHRERRIGQAGFQACRLNREDRRPPCRFEIGDVLDGHDRPLVDQPGEAGGMDSSGARRVNSQPARIFETIQQRDDVGGRGRLRVIPQPGEAGAAQLGIDREQPRERIALRIGQPNRERLKGLLSRPCTSGQSDSLQHRCRRKQDAVRPQMGKHRLDDGFAAIRGPCRVRADPKTGPPVGETEAPETQ